MKINRNKIIFEGWTSQDFIESLEPMFNQIQANNSWMSKFTKNNTKDLKKWCIDNQPYYKKHIPEVFDYFKKRL